MSTNHSIGIGTSHDHPAVAIVYFGCVFRCGWPIELPMVWVAPMDGSGH